MWGCISSFVKKCPQGIRRDMENKTNGKGKSMFLRSLFKSWDPILWWRVKPEILEEQVENYNTFKITESARGVSFLLFIFSSILTLAFSVMGAVSSTGSYEVVLFLIFGFFMYKGQRWAIVISMILWTIEKACWGYDVLTQGSNNAVQFFLQIAWWCVYMHAFYVALRVENLRRGALKQGVK
jgi:hypothetical protein